MDFKGHFPLTQARAGRCHPLTVLDDHSRFAVCLAACGNETRETVQTQLIQVFRRYGLPERLTMDNGSPWGSTTGRGMTAVEAWLIRLGIRVSHSRPYHPQTQGKDERFHRTLKRELLSRQGFSSLPACQTAFDAWRDQYNQIRPHEALGQEPPISRFAISGRSYPETLPEIDYEPGDRVLKVTGKGMISVKGCWRYISEGLIGQRIALRPTTTDGVLAVFYCHQEVGQINLHSPD
jgi:transposase InsO family protein